MGVEKYRDEFSFEELVRSNIPFQDRDMIEQHPFLNKIYPYALNTIHLVTYCENNTVSLLSGSLEIGAVESDNGFVEKLGEISCGLDQQGNLKSHAYKLNTLEKIDKHPQTRFVFGGSQIPHFDRLKAFVISLHIQNKVEDVVSWKLALTSKGQVILLTLLTEKENLL
ncbi:MULTISPECIES: sugar-transfer associated ATP-grasp domain-containing protein [Planococcus]|uniref:Hexapeptide transferase n=1 Tax=Planococcus faecalis TaxID=1598147 RepID=A0ABM6IU92_9BACL|nr:MULTISPECIES: sugar-transfer associated ATP-grasp domain-containing protein [Planococcus]AQU80118.1 hexapeptide transferase [Planococcus faecalis]MDJ0330505.1 sugar-transfer associated ATP-grasp domain-containing protein [Planococcus sp. S3-L1]OHX52565.1 hexapeptide transferase [Planococcus faecalis]